MVTGRWGSGPLRLILAVVVVQALYWGLLSPWFSPTLRPPERLEQGSFEMARVAAPDWASVAAARFAEVEYPWGECCEPGYRAVRVRFDLARVPDEGIAEVPVIGADNYQTRVNGVLLWAEGRMELPRPSYHGREYRGINRIPASALKVGTNEIVYTLVRGAGGGEFFVGRPTLGAYAPMVEYFTFTRFMLNEYFTISITIGLLTALLAMVAWLRGGRQPYLLWLAVLAAAWAGKLQVDDVTDPWLRGTALAFLLNALLLAIPLAWINLANVWAGRQLRLVLPVSLALFGLALAASGWLAWFPDPDAAIQPDRLAFWFSGLAAIAVVALLLRKLPGLKPEQAWECAIFVLCATILLRDAVGEVFDIFAFGSSTDLTLPFLLVALMAAFLARNIRLFRSAEQIAALLQVRLDERTAELAAAHARETQLVRRQAHHDERGRIMRDMHDGLGSNLMAMLLAARRGVAEPAAVAEGLQAVIDEMRLMIDSMDSVGESLATALATFRARLGERVGAAGFALDWADSAPRPLPDYPPRAVLQVFRVMQEAVTNALKHSGGDAIAVTIAPGTRPGEALAIAIADNGRHRPVEPGGRSGRGLQNMRTRAASIGARLAIDAGDAGTTIELHLPATPRGEPEG